VQPGARRLVLDQEAGLGPAGGSVRGPDLGEQALLFEQFQTSTARQPFQQFTFGTGLFVEGELQIVRDIADLGLRRGHEQQQAEPC